jgi:hypothetical protein
MIFPRIDFVYLITETECTLYTKLVGPGAQTFDVLFILYLKPTETVCNRYLILRTKNFFPTFINGSKFLGSK